MLFLCLSCVSRVFLGTRSRATLCFLYLLVTSLRCLVLLGFSCFILFPFFYALSMSFLCFSCFSRYPFSCHVVLLVSSGNFSALSRALRFLVFHSLSVLLCSFYVFLVFLVFSRYPFSCHVVLLVSSGNFSCALSRALRFLVFHALSVLLCSFYVFLVFLVVFSVPVLVPCCSVVWAIVWLVSIKRSHMFFILFAHLPVHLQRQTCEIIFFPKICLNTSKMYRYILEVFLENVQYTSWGTLQGVGIIWQPTPPPTISFSRILKWATEKKDWSKCKLNCLRWWQLAWIWNPTASHTTFSQIWR